MLKVNVLEKVEEADCSGTSRCGRDGGRPETGGARGIARAAARGRRRVLSECLINRVCPGHGCLAGMAVCRAGQIADAGSMIPMCDDQEGTRARACPGYAPRRSAGQGLSQ
jgi:hypothetical protein